MKLFKPVTVKMDDATIADLDRILEAERRHNPRQTIGRGGIIRDLIHTRARQVTRRTSLRDTNGERPVVPGPTR